MYLNLDSVCQYYLAVIKALTFSFTSFSSYQSKEVPVPFVLNDLLPRFQQALQWRHIVLLQHFASILN